MAQPQPPLSGTDYLIGAGGCSFLLAIPIGVIAVVEIVRARKRKQPAGSWKWVAIGSGVLAAWPMVWGTAWFLWWVGSLFHDVFFNGVTLHG